MAQGAVGPIDRAIVRPGNRIRTALARIGVASLAMMAIAGTGSGAATPQASASVTSGTVLAGVTVVDTHNGALMSDRDVVIDGDRIVRIIPGRSVAVGGAAQRIDARGKFVVPGYLDMHAHAIESRDSQRLMLANGITGFRQMAGSPELLAQYRADKRVSPPDLPELLALPGTILTSANAATPALAVAEVKRQKAQGADFIKMIDVPPPAFFAAMDEAKRQGLPLVGHLPPLVSIWDASRAGMHSVEHMGPVEGIILACSSEEAALRKSLADNAPARPQISGPIPARTIALTLANPMVATTPLQLRRIQREIDTYDAARCAKLMATFIANDTWMSPTLIRLETMQFGADTGDRDPHIDYVPTGQRALFRETAQMFSAKFTPAQQEVLKRLFEYQLRLVKLFDRHGVQMLVGTDSREVPGFGYHSEIDLLARAGLSPLRILQLATLSGARFLHREATMGSVEAGKDANLVLLDANPVASAQNMHRISGVVRAGHFYSKDALAAMEKEVADRVAAGGGGG